MKRFVAIAGALCAAALLIVLVSPGVTKAQATPQTVNITVSEFMFDPMNINVVQGQPVHFVVHNNGKFPHSVSFSKGGKFLTVFAQPIPGGKTGEVDFTFEEAGNWTMYCPVSNHAERGMVGEALVLAPGAANVPGMPTTGQSQELPTFLAGLMAIGLLTGGLVMRRRWANRPQ